MKKIYYTFNNIIILELLLVVLVLYSYLFNNNTLYNFLLIIIACVLAIVIHELGHFIIGMLCKLKLYLISLVCLVFINRNFLFNFPISLALGMTIMYSEEWNKQINIIKLVLYMSGGIIFNILFSMLLYFILQIIPFVSFIYYLIIMNLIIAFSTALPFIKGNDGYVIYKLIKFRKNSHFYNGFLVNSAFYSNKINTVNHQDEIFKMSNPFQWNIIYLSEKLNNQQLQHGLKSQYNNKYEKIIVSFYLYCLGYIDKFELKTITPIYGKCLFNIRRYIETNNNRYLQLAQNNKNILDHRQQIIIGYILKKYSEDIKGKRK